MAKLLGPMSLELKYHHSGQGAGRPEHLETAPEYAALAAQFQAQLLLLEKSRGTGASSEAAKLAYTSLQEILRLATETAR